MWILAGLLLVCFMAPCLTGKLAGWGVYWEILHRAGQSVTAGWFTGVHGTSTEINRQTGVNKHHLEGRGSVWGVGMGNVNDPVYVIVCMVWERERGITFYRESKKERKNGEKVFLIQRERRERRERFPANTWCCIILSSFMKFKDINLVKCIISYLTNHINYR